MGYKQRKGKIDDGDEDSYKKDEKPKVSSGQQLLPSMIKNKEKRSALHAKLKEQKKLEKRKKVMARDALEKRALELGEELPPKPVPRTIENTREADETICRPDDEELFAANDADEFSAVLKQEHIPKILITTCRFNSTRGPEFISDLLSVIPNTHYYKRGTYDLKKIVEYAKKKDFTSLIVVHTSRREPDALLVIGLPDGPTAHFKLTKLVLRKDIKNHGNPTSHKPELVLNNFTTQLGHRIGRWNVQLHQPLHAAGYYLNPEFYYSNLDIESDQEVIKGLYTCIEKMVPNQVEQDRIADQIPLYRNAEDLFGISMARRQRTSKSPAEWWKSYGGCAPDLQKLAIKILSLTCSSSGCERNWSTFQHLHSKKRNRLAQQRLNDLVFVKYNRALKRRYALRDTIDPISLSDIDESNEWLMGKLDDDQANDYVFDDDEGLTWQDVATATGAGEARYNSRSQTASNKKKGKQPCEPSTSFPLIDEDEEEELEFEGGNHSNDVDDFNVDHLEDEDED